MLDHEYLRKLADRINDVADMLHRDDISVSSKAADLREIAFFIREYVNETRVNDLRKTG